MEVVVVTLLLLAAGAWCCAGAGILSPGLQSDVTSPLDRGTPAAAQLAAYGGPSRLRVLRDFPSLAVEHGPVSVVQDWSLVCVQLCGASLGGEPCAPYCASVAVPEGVRVSNAEILLSPNRDVICEDLCTLKLGGSVCKCSSATSSSSVEARNQVCQTFCVNNRITLAGCSICAPTQPLIDWSIRDVDDSTATNTEEATKAEVAVASGNPATDPTTTPDWNALCVTLCKTGDGGSLCNCDLSPFF